MEKQTKIIDASIVVKWFVVEENSKKALDIRNDHINGNIKIIVPDLTFIEVLNALKYKGKTEEDLKEANKDLWDIQLQIIKTTSFTLNKAIEIALKHDITLYDALYISLSTIYGCPLITADKKLADLPNVQLI